MRFNKSDFLQCSPNLLTCFYLVLVEEYQLTVLLNAFFQYLLAAGVKNISLDTLVFVIKITVPLHTSY